MARRAASPAEASPPREEHDVAPRPSRFTPLHVVPDAPPSEEPRSPERIPEILTEVLRMTADAKGRAGVDALVALISRDRGALRAEAIQETLDEIPDRAEYQEAMFELLEEHEYIARGPKGELLVDTDACRRGRIVDLVHGAFHGRARYDAYTNGGVAHALHAAFHDVPVYDRAEWDAASPRERRSLEPMSFLYDPGRADVAFDVDAIRESRFLFTPWEIAQVRANDAYPAFEGDLSMGEVAVACCTYHPKYGAGERDEHGRLTMARMPGGDRRRISGESFTRWWNALRSKMNHPRAFLEREGERLVSSGLLRFSDFASPHLEASSERTIAPGRPHAMVDGVRYYVGRSAVPRRVVEVDADLYGIIAGESPDAPVVEVFPRIAVDDPRLSRGRFPDAPASVAPRVPATVDGLRTISSDIDTVTRRIQSIEAYAMYQRFLGAFDRAGCPFPASAITREERDGVVTVLRALHGDPQALLRCYEMSGVPGLRMIGQLVQGPGSAEATVDLLRNYRDVAGVIQRIAAAHERARDFTSDLGLSPGEERAFLGHVRGGLRGALVAARGFLAERSRGVFAKDWDAFRQQRPDCTTIVDDGSATMTLALAEAIGVEQARAKLAVVVERMAERQSQGTKRTPKHSLERMLAYLTPPVPEGSEAMRDLVALYERIRFEEYHVNEAMQEKDLAVLDQEVARGDRVLDLGAGTGRLIKPLRDRGANVAAVDIVPRHVEQIRKQLRGIDVRKEDWAKTSFADASFDVITAVGRNITHEYQLPRQAALFHEANRLLAVGGRFVFDIPDRARGGYRELIDGYARIMQKRGFQHTRYGTIYDSPDGKAFHTRYAYAPEDITQLAELAGFRVVSVREEPLATNRGDVNFYFTLEKVRNIGD